MRIADNSMSAVAINSKDPSQAYKSEDGNTIIPPEFYTDQSPAEQTKPNDHRR